MSVRPRPLMFFGTTNLDLCFTVERLPTTGETVIGALSRHAGGKGANQAVAAALQGVSTLFFTRIGDDDAGTFLLNRLQSAGVSTEAIEIAPGEVSGSAMVAVGDDGSNLIIIDPGANRRIPADSIARAANFIRSGSVVVAEMGLPIESLEYLCAIKREREFELIFNPAPVQPGLSRRAWGAIDVVTPNQSEAFELTAIEVRDS